MLFWTLLVGGSLVLPFSILYRTDLPPLAAELLSLLGVISLFLAICAAETVGARPAPQKVD